MLKAIYYSQSRTIAAALPHHCDLPERSTSRNDVGGPIFTRHCYMFVNMPFNKEDRFLIKNVYLIKGHTDIRSRS